MIIYSCDDPNSNKTKSNIQCDKCMNFFSKKGGNYKKHYAVCNGIYKPANRGICPYCIEKFNLETLENPSSFMANHVRWCHKNPKREDYVNANRKVNQLNTPEAIIKRAEKIKIAWSEGKYDHVIHNSFKGKNHSEDSKQVMRIKALASDHRRLRKKMIEYKDVMLDSTWELELAKRLDNLGISWERPNPIKWSDEKGVQHNYFPDFYLFDYDIYLDPKNPYAYESQKEKIEILKRQLPNLIIIGTLEECKKWRPW